METKTSLKTSLLYNVHTISTSDHNKQQVKKANEDKLVEE